MLPVTSTSESESESLFSDPLDSYEAFLAAAEELPPLPPSTAPPPSGILPGFSQMA